MIYGEYVCCSVVFGTLVGVFVFSVMWSELLMISAISCPLWSSVYECQSVECVFTSQAFELVCHQHDVCKRYVGSVYVGEYVGLSESGLCASVNCQLSCSW